MKIIKYKKLKNGKYQLQLENSDTLELYEDIILKYDLLLTKKLDSISMKKMLKDNADLDAYYTALKYLEVRIRSKKEIRNYLKKKQYEDEIIYNTILKLEKQGYLNDEVFAKSYLNNKLITTSNGPYKIKKDLKDHEIKDDVIFKIMEDYTLEIQQEKISKHINRIIKSNRNKGNNLLKKKMLVDLGNEGFDKELVATMINGVRLEDDSELAKKEYEKLYKKLSRKYSGSELDYRIKQKLYQKGFNFEP